MHRTLPFLIFLFFTLQCGTTPTTDEPVTYSIGGSITGLSGTVVLQNNEEDDLTITTDGTFTFSTEFADATDYAVTVLTQPDGATCSVSNGTGTVATADVTTITIVCSSTTYTVGGTITGLSGTVVLQNNAGDDLSLTSDGDFTFITAVADGAGYEVTVLTQPSGQTCSIANSSGTLSGAGVTDVTIVCSANTYTVGGTVTGLSGTLVLQNNAGNNLTLTSSGSFTFSTSVADTATYAVTVLTQPSTQTCSLASASGTISEANVTLVTVTCSTNTYTVGGTISSLSGTVVLQNNGGNNSTNTTNGSFTFSTAVADGGAYVVTVLTQPSGYTCTVTNGSGTISGANVTNVSITCADIPCTSSCRIFVTDSTPTGNVGSIAAADALCMADANYPAGSGTFKAMFVDGTNRRACTSASCVTSGVAEHVDWVLAASTSYVRTDNTSIGTTSTLGLLPGTLNASWNGLATFTWTGLDSNPLWVADVNCSNWTSASNGTSGSRGVNNNTDIQSAIGIGTSTCDNQRHLICVEQ